MELTHTSAAAAALWTLVLLLANSASGSYPTAQNVTWSSINFKTVLMWEPKPSSDYSYTVEFSVVGQDKQRNANCIRSSATNCDLSSSLTELRGCYTADILSEPPLGQTSDLIEFPYSSSPRFCPYQDTEISRPEFNLQVSENKENITIHVTDPLTTLFRGLQQLNIRDVFTDDLQYKVTYRRNKSTGKKVAFSMSNVFELSDLDRGESYCFNVQAYLPSRSIDKQLGELSHTQCSSADGQSIFEEYSSGVIAAAVFLILLLIGIVLAVIVICFKRRRNALKKGREGFPLQSAP